MFPSGRKRDPCYRDDLLPNSQCRIAEDDGDEAAKISNVRRPTRRWT
jgi:hypothetical protein